MLKLLAIALFGFTVLAVPQAAPSKGNSACAQWCAQKFPVDTGLVCTSQAAKGTGPCFTCGPSKSIQSQQFCGAGCTDTASDGLNCGACGTVCPQGSTCKSGACICTNSNKAPCKGACPDLENDPLNCGTCGTVVSSSQEFLHRKYQLTLGSVPIRRLSVRSLSSHFLYNTWYMPNLLLSFV